MLTMALITETCHWYSAAQLVLKCGSFQSIKISANF